MSLTDQDRIEMAADNCEVLRARLAKYEDAEGRPVVEYSIGAFDRMQATITEQAREIERLSSYSPQEIELSGENFILRAELASLKAQPSGVVLPERREVGPQYPYLSSEDVEWNACLDEVARLNSSPVSAGGVDERAALATLERFVETVRECYHLASSYSGCLDNVDEHGGDYHEDPICAVFHRLYYAMFDGDKALELARAALSAPSHGEQVREVVPEALSHKSMMLAFRLITTELRTLANGSAIDRFKSAQAEFRKAIDAAPSAGSQGGDV